MLNEHYRVVMTYDALKKDLYMLCQGYQRACLSMVYGLYGMSRSFQLSFLDTSEINIWKEGSTTTSTKASRRSII